MHFSAMMAKHTLETINKATLYSVSTITKQGIMLVMIDTNPAMLKIHRTHFNLMSYQFTMTKDTVTGRKGHV